MEYSIQQYLILIFSQDVLQVLLMNFHELKQAHFSHEKYLMQYDHIKEEGLFLLSDLNFQLKEDNLLEFLNKLDHDQEIFHHEVQVQEEGYHKPFFKF